MGKAYAVAQPAALGDVMACLPMACAIKRHDPGATVIFIGRSYSRDLIAASTQVDQFLDADEVVAHPDLLSEYGVDVFLNPYLHLDLGLAARRAGVPIRVANLRRLKSLLWGNRFILQSSAKIQRHRALLNLAYLRPLGIQSIYSLAELGGMIRLELSTPLEVEYSHLLDLQKFNLVIHPKSGKNAREWPGSYFDRLIDLLPAKRVKVFITGLSNERDELLAENAVLHRTDIVDLVGRLDLTQLIAFLKHADGFVGNSTGPLHVAGGLGIHTLGLFPGRDRTTAERWRPLGAKAEALSFRTVCKPGPGRCLHDYGGGSCDCMIRIAPERVAETILRWMN